MDSAHPMGWRNLCWSLWTLRRYADASAACRSAAAHRDWRPRVRARIMTLDRACSMMMALERARATEEECPSARLLRGWYATTLRNLVSEARLEVFAAPPAARDVSPDVLPAPARGLWLPGAGAEAQAQAQVQPQPQSGFNIEIGAADGTGHVHFCARLSRCVSDEDCAVLVQGNGGTEELQPGGRGGRGIVGWRSVRFGGDGAQRDLPASVFDGFPLDQATGGNVYTKERVTPLNHCNFLEGYGHDVLQRIPCYGPRSAAVGPCAMCLRYQFPLPVYRFPHWDPEPTVPSVVVHSLGPAHAHPLLDAHWATGLVPKSVLVFLRARLDELAARSPAACSPAPQYHNIIDPNVGAVDGRWVPVSFDCAEVTAPRADILLAVELACFAATRGRLLPPGFARRIALAAGPVPKRARCRLCSPLPDIDPHQHAALHVAVQGVFESALPLLARLRRPALLLPGPLQAVVKAQRICFSAGGGEQERYEGVWHEDGLEEHVIAVVLFYYRVPPGLRGGAIELASKHRVAMWTGDAGGPRLNLDGAQNFARRLPRAVIPVEEGMLLVFSNYAQVHRVLPMLAAPGTGPVSRDFLAFFVIDQRRPLPVPRDLGPLGARLGRRATLLARQLQPRGKFGIGSGGGEVYSTGNGRVADIGWLAGGGRDVDVDLGCSGGAEAPITRLNMLPPVLRRGASYFELAATVASPKLVFNQESRWAEHIVRAGCLLLAQV